jgi:hypothetical protein
MNSEKPQDLALGKNLAAIVLVGAMFISEHRLVDSRRTAPSRTAIELA